MFKKTVSILISLVLFATCFSACSKSEKTGEAFAFAISNMPEHLDPQIASDTVEKMIVLNLFDGLFKLDENGVPQKCMAADYSVSSDRLKYTFELVKDTYFGFSASAKELTEEKGVTVEAKVTAEDFVFGITRAILPETNAPDYSLLSAIKNADAVHNGKMSANSLGIRATGEYTLEIVLERADEDFLYALSQPVSFPCDEEFFNLTGGRYGLSEEYIITNGGFYLSNITEEKSVRIAKSESYKGNFPAIPSAVGFYLNTYSVNVADKLDKGDYDVGFFSDEDAIKKLGRSVQQEKLSNITCALVFNMENETLKNSALRTGLVSGIDINAVTDDVAQNIVPSYFKFNGAQIVGSPDGIGYSKDAAHNSMIKAYDELGVNNLTLEIICDSKHEKIAKKIVNSWQNSIGVELNGTVKAVDSKEFEKCIDSGEYQLAILPITVDSDDARDFLEIFTAGHRNNVFNYSSEEYNRIFKELKNNPTTENAAYCQNYLLKNAIVLPVCGENTVFAKAKGVSGVYFCRNTSNVYFYKGTR